MNQQQFARRTFLQGMGGLAAAATFGRIPDVAAAEALSFWAPGIAKVAAKDFSAMEAQAGIAIKHIAKSARADEAIQKMVVGDGQKLYDALTDNGGGMEDALAQNEAIVPLDPGRIPNWSNILPTYREGGDAAETLRYEGQLYGVPYISNADSMAYNYDELGFHPDSWGVMFDSQFKGRVALQNDFGPTLTNMAIYLQQSGKIDIVNPADMTPDEVKAVCQYLIDYKKKGQFRTFWDGFMNGVDLFASREVVMASCWEPIQLVAVKKGVKRDVRDHEGRASDLEQCLDAHQGRSRARRRRCLLQARERLPVRMVRSAHPRYLRLRAADGGSRSLSRREPGRFRRCCPRPPEGHPRAQEPALRDQGQRLQNVFPTHIRAYQDWWSRLQAA